MKNQCLQCLNEFETVRPAKFCSTNCRTKNHRTVTDNLVTDNSVTDNVTDVVTDKEEEFETINGVKLSYDHVCVECKKPVHPLITICLPCFMIKRNKGKDIVREPIKDSEIKNEEK